MLPIMQTGANITGEFHTKPEYLEACNCKSVCHEVQYSARLSTYKFPSQRYVEDLHLSKGADMKIIYSKNIIPRFVRFPWNSFD